MTTPLTGEATAEVTLSKSPKVFRARTPLELMIKAYMHNGWPITLGRMAKKFVEHYEMTTDHPNNRYIATPRFATSQARDHG